VNAWTVFISVCFQGIAWVLMHTTLQTWATSLSDKARAMAVSLFAGSMFLGNGAGAYVASHLLEFSGTVTLFGFATLTMVALTVVSVAAQRHYSHRTAT